MKKKDNNNFNCKLPLNTAFVREEGKSYLCLSCCMVVNNTIPCPRCGNVSLFTDFDSFEDLINSIIDERSSKTVVSGQNPDTDGVRTRVYFSFDPENSDISIIDYAMCGSKGVMPRDLIRILSDADCLVEHYVRNLDEVEITCSDKAVYSAIVEFSFCGGEINLTMTNIVETNWRSYE